MSKIAYVDDSASMRRFGQVVLGGRGHDVVPFASGDEALSAVGAGGFDLVISDVQMRGMDGVELCRRLRERFDKRRLPIVLVSVLEAEDDILRGFDAGASDWLVKPLRPALLQSKVKILLGSAAHDADAPEPARPERVGDELPCRFDKYVMEEELGRGGMGAVYRARRLADDSAFALKLLAPELGVDREALARYFREVAILSQVQSPRVVRIVDSGREQGRYFLVMELLPGRSAALLRRSGRLDERRVLDIAQDVTEALQALHERGLLHRDVKPGNIVFDQQGRAVLVDFGLAKRQGDADVTRSPGVMGTPHFLAPELLRGASAHPGSDLYALGVTLYELLTGRLPYAHAGSPRYLQEVLDGARVPVAKARPGTSAALAAVIDRLLAPDLTRRFGAASEVRRAFAAVALD